MSIVKMNPDIKEERDKVSFVVEDFTNWFYGGEENVKERRFVGKLFNWEEKKNTFLFSITSENYFFNDPDLQIDVDISYLSHKEKYEEAIRRSTVLLKKLQKLQSEGHGGKNLNE